MMRGDILGHEFMGEIVEIGSAVKTLKIGDRVIVPFAIACGRCWFCTQGLTSLCDNTNPNAWMNEALLGYAASGLYGYSHMYGGYAGGQAEYVRVPFADFGPMVVPEGLTDEQVLFLTDILPTGYMGADMCGIKPGDTVAVWGCGPVGQFAIASAYLLGAERVIAIDRFPYRLEMAREKAGAITINYEEVDSVNDVLKDLTGGRGPDHCIDAVGTEGHTHGLPYLHDRAKQLLRVQSDRPIALREAIAACASGGTVSVVGVYAGLIDKFPMNAVLNRYLTIRAGQCNVHAYMKPLLERIQKGELDPTFVITHRMPLAEAARGYKIFNDKLENCEKIVLKA
jgi:threonine dehydrogenase-like Zn-dependent dehydrogenase